MGDNNKSNAKNLLIGLILGGTIVALFLFMNQQLKVRNNYVALDRNIRIKVEAATTDSERYRGLSDRASLCKNCGLLFVWPDKATRTFVMRNMRFPLDIIFIADDRIVKIDSNLTPEGPNPKETYESLVPVNYVLEINGGLTDLYGIEVGDEAFISITEK